MLRVFLRFGSTSSFTMTAHALRICLVAAAGLSVVAQPFRAASARPDGRPEGLRYDRRASESDSAVSQADRVAGVLAEARALIDAGQPRKAVAALEALRVPDDPRVAHLLGVAAYHADDYARAIEILTPIRSRFEPGTTERREVVQVLGLSLFLTGRLADAVPHLEATREWAAGNLELAHILGQAYLQTGRLEQARGEFARTFGVAPASAAAHLVTAQMMIRGQLEGPAEEELRRAIAKGPTLPQANLLLGQLALFRGNYEECIALTRRELEVAPGSAMAYSQIGDAYVRQSKWTEAIAALQQSLWLNPYYSAPYILLGKAYSRTGNLGTAEGMLRRAIQYDPNNRSAHYLLAQLLQQMGRGDEAKREFAIAEKLPK
jgi:tetratricopeptide (TPR) repeat protein